MTKASPILRQRLQLKLLSSQHKKQSLFQKGFTLVELMIVIVIVGVLSAVALPNFLSQTDKAKLSEAKTQASAYLKQYYAASFDGSTDDITCPATTANFSFDCSTAATIVATGVQGTSVAGKTYTATVNTTTGALTLPAGLSG